VRRNQRPLPRPGPRSARGAWRHGPGRREERPRVRHLPGARGALGGPRGRRPRGRGSPGRHRRRPAHRRDGLFQRGRAAVSGRPL
ncbi:MAG: hypothetical protein AVDCRST_MAG05-1411, partial [uncultured Rubrobacteraceae bacterium]